MTKRRMLIIAVVVIALASLATGSFAVPVTGVSANSTVTTSGVAIELKEWADVDKTVPYDGSKPLGVMPGVTVTKIVEAANVGGTAAWIRARIEKEITLAPGVQGMPDSNLIHTNSNTEMWMDGEDGWFYYAVPLEPGETGTPLFTELRFDPAMGDEYQNAQVVVRVVAQSVQTANNGRTVMEAAGWPAGELGEEIVIADESIAIG